MKLNITSQQRPDRRRDAFTLMEVLVAVMIVGVTFVTYYLGMTQGFGIIQLARENLRATQILQEKMETIRLYTWDQVTNSGFIPATFTATFYPQGTQTNQGVTYQGTYTLTNVPSTVTGPYVSDLRMAIFQLTWQSGSVQRQREMRTLVSHYGLHNYIYQ
ncbi:MAG TPA: prepilin-type N-terminal cleavage/methylation domain-containing protein [Candidatus Angelobacter sp.]|nr:prepilin-type N-terminal cleavage/methylation domain-containing protein [Candidatus Angelobacter sp.]